MLRLTSVTNIDKNTAWEALLCEFTLIKEVLLL